MRIRQFLTVAAISLMFGAPAFGQGMAPSAGTKPASTMAAPAKPAALIDINSASKDELEALKGIGPVRAEAIIKGRPYRGKDELHQKNIISKSLYDGIKDQIIAKQKS